MNGGVPKVSQTLQVTADQCVRGKIAIGRIAWGSELQRDNAEPSTWVQIPPAPPNKSLIFLEKVRGFSLGCRKGVEALSPMDKIAFDV